MIEIILNSTPVAWAASKVCGKIHYDPKSKEKIRTRSEVKHQYGYNTPPIQGFVSLEFTFCFSPPKSASKKQREKMLLQETFPTRMDTTNMQKFYEDCIKNILIEDDRYVFSAYSKKIYAQKDSIIIRVFQHIPYETEEKCK